jgi:hypothetical protein
MWFIICDVFLYGPAHNEKTCQFVFGPKKTFGPIGLIVNENNNEKSPCYMGRI